MLEADMTSNAQRITNIESDYAKEYVDTAIIASTLAGGVVDGAIATFSVPIPTNWGTLAPADNGLDTYIRRRQNTLSETVVRRPLD